LDRFLMRLPVGYPSPADERTILVNLQREHPILGLQAVEFKPEGEAPDGGTVELPGESLSHLSHLQKLVWEVHIDDSLQDYIIRLVGATRQHLDLALGGSPRASLALFKTCQALAAARGRDHVIPDDVKYLAPFTLLHRLIVQPEAELRGRKAANILQDVLSQTALNIGE